MRKLLLILLLVLIPKIASASLLTVPWYYSTSTASIYPYPTTNLNVGIGTSTPQYRLSVAGDFPEFQLYDTFDNKNFEFRNIASSFYFLYDNIQFLSSAGTDLELFSNNIETMRLQNGNVGIGTSTPFTKLSVQGESAGSKFTAYDRTATSTFYGVMVPGSSVNTIIGTTGYIGVNSLSPGGPFEADGDGSDSCGGNTKFTVGHTDFTIQGCDVHIGDTSFAGNGSTLDLYGTLGSWNFANSKVGIGTTTPGTSLSIGNTGNNTINISNTATSTFGTGINLRSGCFSVNGVCAGTGAGTVTSVATNNGLTGGTITTSGTIGLNTTSLITNAPVTWNGSNLAATGTPTFSAGNYNATSTSLTNYFAGSLGVGTTTPLAKLSVSNQSQQSGLTPLLVVASTTNATLFNVLGNGNVGIGSTTPASALSVIGDGVFSGSLTTYTGLSVIRDGAAAQLTTTTYSNSAGVLQNFRRARGSLASPSAINSGDSIFNYNLQGWNGTTFVVGGSINAAATETWSSTARGTAMGFNTVDDGTTLVTRKLTLDLTGVTIGDGYPLNLSGNVFNNSLQTTVNCSVSGSVEFLEPEQGQSDKRVVAHLSACNGTASWTYPTAFSVTPTVVSDATIGPTATTVTTTGVTITGATNTGSLYLIGY